jgi:hypothetical protein
VALAQLRVEPGAVSIAGRRQAARCVKPNRANRHHARCRRTILVRITYTLTATTAVTLTIARQSAGRRVGHHCLTPTRKNRRHARCLRLITITGHLTQNATTGRDTLVFYGTIGGRVPRRRRDRGPVQREQPRPPLRRDLAVAPTAGPSRRPPLDVHPDLTGSP